MTEPMTAIGKREANRRATRAALEQAAQKLFAERGFAATTVSDIATAAGVTERTFFRYFTGKEELILDDVLAGMPLLQQAIRDRPASEPPLLAVARAAKTLLAAAGDQATASPLLLFTEGRPTQRLGPSGTRFLLRIENDLADAIADRLARTAPPASDGGPGDPGDARFQAELTARTSLAIFRSILIRDSQLRQTQAPRRPPLSELADQAIELIKTGL
jgi:AcrR family transcriptional regulator